ncbi:DUF4114 domain-containing protein [Pacificimonas flava]|nr:DUF4114 domain-containing protein [Pacificimonas flava]MBB5281705.1 hypothetical protein [Pacificimonas flava]
MDELVISEDGQSIINTGTIVGEGHPAVTITGSGNVFANGGTLRVGGNHTYAAVHLSGEENTVINEGQIAGRTALLGSSGADYFENAPSGQRTGFIQMGAGNDYLIDRGKVLSSAAGESAVSFGEGNDTYVFVSGEASVTIGTESGQEISGPVVAVGGQGQDTFVLDVMGASLFGSFELDEFETLRLVSSAESPADSLSFSGFSNFENIFIEESFSLTLSQFSNPTATLSLAGGAVKLQEESVVNRIEGSSEEEDIRLDGASTGAETVSLGSGDDVLILQNGSSISGMINGGDGNDRVVAEIFKNSLDLSKFTNVENLAFVAPEDSKLRILGQTDANATIAVLTYGGEIDLDVASAVSGIISPNEALSSPAVISIYGTVFEEVTLGYTNDILSNSGSVMGPIDLGAGDDIYRDAGAAGMNTVLLGEGVDRVEGDFGDLVDDSFNGFDEDDTLYLMDARYALEDFGIGRGDLFTFSRDDQSIIFTDTDVDFDDGDLIFSGNDGGTEISFLDFLPALADGQAVGAGDINGVGAQQYLNGDTASRFVISLEQASAVADFTNSLGVYEVDAAGNIVDVRVIADNVKTDAGDIEVSGIDAGHQLGFFIIQKGADLFGAEVLSSDDLGIDIVDGAAVLTNGGSAVDGATIFVSHNGSLNVDGMEHVVTGASEERDSTLRMGFEDLLRDDQSTDDDFQDVILHIEAMPDTTLAATADIL